MSEILATVKAALLKTYDAYIANASRRDGVTLLADGLTTAVEGAADDDPTAVAVRAALAKYHETLQADPEDMMVRSTFEQEIEQLCFPGVTSPFVRHCFTHDSGKAYSDSAAFEKAVRAAMNAYFEALCNRENGDAAGYRLQKAIDELCYPSGMGYEIYRLYR